MLISPKKKCKKNFQHTTFLTIIGITKNQKLLMKKNLKPYLASQSGLSGIGL